MNCGMESNLNVFLQWEWKKTFIWWNGSTGSATTPFSPSSKTTFCLCGREKKESWLLRLAASGAIAPSLHQSPTISSILSSIVVDFFSSARSFVAASEPGCLHSINFINFISSAPLHGPNVNLYFFQLTHSQQSTIRSWRSNVYNYCYNIFQQSLSFNPKKTKLF